MKKPNPIGFVLKPPFPVYQDEPFGWFAKKRFAFRMTKFGLKVKEIEK